MATKKKAMKKAAPKKKVVKKATAKKTVKPSKALKKAVKSVKTKLPTVVKQAVLEDRELPAAKPRPEQVKPSGRAVAKGGGIVFEADQDVDNDAPKGKSVIIRGGKPVVVEDSENLD